MKMPSSWTALALGGGCLLASAIIILRPLARFWRENPDYNYGWGVPFLALYLIYERWRFRPDASRARGTFGKIGLLIAAWGLLALGTRLVIETEPASRPLLLIDAGLLVGAVMAWFGLLGGWPWARHFAFPAAFLLMGVPWIFGLEFMVVQDLMRVNAAAVAGTLTLLDIPARAAGNTIELATGQLGVNEACSGIRSLQAALMMSLFFGEFYRYGWRGRTVLVAAGTALALTGNLTRMLYLAWRGARDGVGSVAAVHDSAGWLILVFTVISLWLGCVPTRPTESRSPTRALPPAPRGSLAWACGVLAITLLAEAATQGWYDWREHSAPHYPTWSVVWPEHAPGFRPWTVPEAVRGTLHARTASAAGWRDAAGHRWNGLWIRYGAGAEGKVVFESHNPSLCLPAAGWTRMAGAASFPLQIGGIRLHVERSDFRIDGETAQVFWIPYVDGGVRADADRTPGLYGHSFAALARGRLPWLADAWAGCRGVQAETLELARIGPGGVDDAEHAFRLLAPALIRPDAAPSSSRAESGR